ncbi:ATP-binding protein [Streptacidiphilus jiangxiensis]|uniref:Histidine kinase-like ATPase domain-containing protein n=1 Tax=Streptacidiphilus jiangxiensis TaxID=235985 RepID=A0A1H7WAE6_STRJI|nr:ATP-binding protein [Streptacidiphilus jiangxiensis]SEM17978.1 Histidine kinase-like ATPase domain-containing protein [Streptacidiphilus jiangxiensis]
MSHARATAPSPGPRHLAFSDIEWHEGHERVTAGIDFVRRAVSEWQVGRETLGGDEEQAVDVLLVAAELLSNAERHGGGATAIDLEPRSGVLRLTVTDASPLPPRPVRPHRPERTGGHGLHIIDCLSAAWGWVSCRSGKAVWAELSADSLQAR